MRLQLRWESEATGYVRDAPLWCCDRSVIMNQRVWYLQSAPADRRFDPVEITVVAGDVSEVVLELRVRLCREPLEQTGNVLCPDADGNGGAV